MDAVAQPVIPIRLSLAGCNSQDPFLVGKWKGERDPATKCQFLAWTTELKPNGDFTTDFYNESERSRRVYRRAGYWAGNKEMLLLDAVGAKKYNVYSYKVIDAVNTYSDCDGRYVFTDHRIRE